MTEDRIPRCPDCGQFYSRHDADSACGGPNSRSNKKARREEAMIAAYSALSEEIPGLRAADIQLRLIAPSHVYCSTHGGRRRWCVDLFTRQVVEAGR